MNDTYWTEAVNDAIETAIESRIASIRTIAHDLLKESLGLIERRSAATTSAERSEIDLLMGGCTDRCGEVEADFQEVARELRVVRDARRS